MNPLHLLAHASPAAIATWSTVAFMFAAITLVILMDRLWPPDGP